MLSKRMLGVVAALMAATLVFVIPKAQGSLAPVQQYQARAVQNRPVSLLVEEGFSIPPQILATVKRGKSREVIYLSSLIRKEAITLPEKEDAAQEAELTFTISGSPMRFKTVEGVMATGGIKDGIIATPTIEASSPYDESVVQLVVDGNPIIEDLRVATLPPGGIGEMVRYLSPHHPAIIVLGDHYAMVDENNLGNIPEEAVTIDNNSLATMREGGHLQAVAGLCIRTPFKPGIVKWAFSNPFQLGFSVKPEGPNIVVRATAPSNEADGVYHRRWGCYTALKIPDSCTVTWYSSIRNDWSACCNATLAYFGYVPKWVDTRLPDPNDPKARWPDCPL